ncbi:MAG: carboxypeptidase-like regulatory domain-containing protein [Candidatus Zixiibacteriota bacterium]|nr:MAG: carboxypeptidase-like regulatory domain-containing protein [candidate division Zixibacteria bacterium]
MARILVLVLSVCLAQVSSATTVTGYIKDVSTNAPVAFATVAAQGTTYSTSANEEGYFLLRLPEGNYELKFSHVAHYSQTTTVEVADTNIVINIFLEPSLVEVSAIRVYDRQYDAAQRIIIEAIKRKDELLSQIKHYSFKAYAKASVIDTSKADSSNFMAILETQAVAFHEYPDKHKEIITARRQSANARSGFNLVSVGDLLDFNRNRIDLGRYSLVSPTATDALDYYDYYLMDTVLIDNRAVYVLEIEAKNQTDPLFEGEIMIADSTYAVVGVDFGFNDGFDEPAIHDPHYRQIYSEFQNKYWMPTMIQFETVVNIGFPAVPVFALDFQAALHNYDFPNDLPDTLFNEYTVEVSSDADDVDSATWKAGQLMPLTSLEERGYVYIDSLEHNKPLHKKLMRASLGIAAIMTMAHDIFHFNRVEGFYLGAGYKFTGLRNRWDLRFKTGYAFDAEFWQHEYGVDYMLCPRQKLKVGAEFRNEVHTRPTIFAPPNGNSTFMAITNKTDPYNYYREKGFQLRGSVKLLDKTRWHLSYQDFDQGSLDNGTEFSMLRQKKLHRPNPAIVDGKLRSIESSLRFDSRKLIKYKNRDYFDFTPFYTTFRLGVEYASDDFIGNDFDFIRYYAWLYRRQRMFGWGFSTLFVYAGASDQTLPPQKYFTVDFGSGVFDHRLNFHTLGEINFSGSRTLAIYAIHDFERKLFQKTGIPVIKDLPFTLAVYGGVFWTDLKGNPTQPGDEQILVATKPYSEIGFSMGRLIPWGFLRGFSLNFSWQISEYYTHVFALGLTHEWFE